MPGNVSVFLNRGSKDMSYWGYHLMLDVKGCDREKITDAEYLSKFTKDLVERIDMTAYGEPQVVHFGTGDNIAGYSVLQLIETSNIAGHFVDSSGDMYLDVFSCKWYDKEIVIKAINDYFQPESVKHQYFERQA